MKDNLKLLVFVLIVAGAMFGGVSVIIPGADLPTKIIVTVVALGTLSLFLAIAMMLSD